VGGVAKPGGNTPAAHAAAAISTEQAEIRRLRRDLERAQMERDILKKAIGIFSGPPR
jgi:transposase